MDPNLFEATFKNVENVEFELSEVFTNIERFSNCLQGKLQLFFFNKK